MSGTYGPPFVLIGIDPGATAGLVAMRFRPADTRHAGAARPPEVQILAGQVVLSKDVITDPTSCGLAIASAAVLLAHAHNAVGVAIEIPKGAIRKQVVTSWGAQREVIGAIRAMVRAHHLEDIPVAPSSAKLALTGRGTSATQDKDPMLAALRGILGWERLWDTAEARLAAKADAVGICMAGAARRRDLVAA